MKPLTFLLVTFECIGKISMIFGTYILYIYNMLTTYNNKWCDANFVIINT